MNSNKDSSVVLPQPSMEQTQKNGSIVFDYHKLQKQANLPTEFIWPNLELAQEELREPLIDLHGFLSGDERATAEAIDLVRGACVNHGFFQVINHGVDASLLKAAIEETDSIFKLPLERKLSIPIKTGLAKGYAGAHAGRFTTNLPWKETFTFNYHEKDAEPLFVDYFKSVFGQDFERKRWIYQKYCQAMWKLSGVLFELLAMSLGVDRKHYKKFFEDGYSIVRFNFYPPCKNSALTLGTGPHYDPNSLTILHQEQVEGLEVFSNNKWQTIRPRSDALVINIGDTFVALSNGLYKSCLHRAVVNGERERRSLAFFVNPKADNVVRPPQDLICREGTRLYPDFTWSQLLGFTQKLYRADAATLPSFISWLSSSKDL
ncbi:Fe2OG dioxygenase domain-containing protein [Citrus sinensis]|nr:gibberellin 20 oxidase 1-B [Citrus x clementina]XP_052300104.1 gibberellin 20 oxidase 1-B-like [Citrus sinensis]XP_052300105.1 gibberellin 20 oxidase 1-B [Citrus sinensis]KAH9668787.1 Fe2OG dioxygenase domain-containing protein [Citrus sinensis]KAH9668791.1 Fe2OG dioxygenase domain-containing protein [Citrus sinensis]